MFNFAPTQMHMAAAIRKTRAAEITGVVEAATDTSEMTSSNKEQPVVASSGEFWDIEDVRLYRSTDPQVLLFTPTRLALERSGRNGRYQAAVTQFRRADGGLWQSVGGTALLVFTSAFQPAVGVCHQFTERWRSALFEQGYTGNLNPVFLPLPRRRQRVEVELENEIGSCHHLGKREVFGETHSLVIELTSHGAQEWGRGIREKTPVRGTVRWIYQFPQMLPDAEACFTVNGANLSSQMHHDDGDLSLRLILKARMWIETQIETDFTALLQPLDETYLNVAQLKASTAFPVVVRSDLNEPGRLE